MSARYDGHQFPPGSEGDPRRPELEQLVTRTRHAIGQVLGSPALHKAPQPMILAGRRRSFVRAYLPVPAGVGAWIVLGASRLEVARRWLAAGRAQDAADLLDAPCDELEVPLVFVFDDGVVSLSRALCHVGGVS